MNSALDSWPDTLPKQPDYKKTAFQNVYPGKVLVANNIDEVTLGLEDVSGICDYITRCLIKGADFKQIIPEHAEKSTDRLREFMTEKGLPFPPKENVITVPVSDELKLIDSMNQNLGDIRSRIEDCDYLLPFLSSDKTDEFFRLTGIDPLRNAESGEIINNKALGTVILGKRGVQVFDGISVFTDPRNINRAARDGAIIPTNDSFMETDYGLHVYQNEESLFTAFKQLNKRYENIVLKLPDSASGCGIIHCFSEEDLAEALKNPIVRDQLHRFGLRLEGWLTPGTELADGSRVDKILGSPGLMIFIGDTPEDDRFFCASDQDLKGDVHMGNLSPMPDEFWTPEVIKAIQEVRKWAREHNAQGFIGLDFLITRIRRPNGRTEIRGYLAELNGRVTGQLHAALLSHNAGRKITDAWGANNNIYIPKDWADDSYFDVTEKCLAHLERNGLAYNPSTGKGVIPANIITKGVGKIQIAAFGDTVEEVREIMKAASIIPAGYEKVANPNGEIEIVRKKIETTIPTFLPPDEQLADTQDKQPKDKPELINATGSR